MRSPSASGRDPAQAEGPAVAVSGPGGAAPEEAARGGLGRSRGPGGPRVPARRWGRALALALALVTTVFGCTDTRGIVQIAWSFVDRGGNSVFPGPLGDTCSFHGVVDGADRSFDLRVAVRLCDPECSAGCGDDGCLLVDPLVYSCLGARGSSEVPAMDTPYEFKVEVLADLGSECTCVIEEPCAEVPGPRLRMVRTGLITDLQVYQLVLGLASPSQAELSLEGCCALPPGCL